MLPTYAERILPSDQSDIYVLVGQTILTGKFALVTSSSSEVTIAHRRTENRLRARVRRRPNGLSAIFGFKKFSLEDNIHSWTPELVFFKSPFRLVPGGVHAARRKERCMSDDKANPGRPDRNRINMQEEYEVQYWSEKFGVSQEELTSAVKKVGPMASDVKRELKTHSRYWLNICL